MDLAEKLGKEIAAQLEAGKAKVIEAKLAEKTLVDLYEEFAEKSLKQVQEALEDNFPGNWELQPHASSLRAAKKHFEIIDNGSMEANQKYLDSVIKGSRADQRSSVAYTIVIRFPKLKVTNSDGSKTEMTDMFVKIDLTPMFSGRVPDLFHGQRTSFRWAEYSSNYTFSHLSGGTETLGTFTRFCLGSTDFSILVYDVARTFDANKFYLFCVQLPDYLSWESISGGPYRHLRNISERNGDNASTPAPSSTMMEAYYLEFLKEGLDFDVEIVSNPYYYTAVVQNNDKLRENVTKIVTNREHLEIWDPVTKRSHPEVRSGREALIRRAEGRFTNPLLTFKGEPYRLIITDKGADAVESKDVIRTASPAIVAWIHRRLQERLTKHISDEFAK